MDGRRSAMNKFTTQLIDMPRSERGGTTVGMGIERGGGLMKIHSLERVSDE